MISLESDKMTDLGPNDHLTFTFHYTCILAKSQFFTASKSDFKLLRFSLKGKMSKLDATGQYWSVVDNISKCLTILGYI